MVNFGMCYIILYIYFIQMYELYVRMFFEVMEKTVFIAYRHQYYSEKVRYVSLILYLIYYYVYISTYILMMYTFYTAPL